MLPIYSSDIYTMIRAGIVCNIMFHSRFNAAIICYIHFRDLHSMDLTHSIISIQTKWYTILINPMRTCQSNVNDIASKANKISSNLYTTSMAKCSSRTKHVFVSLVFFSSRLLNALSNPLWMEVKLSTRWQIIAHFFVPLSSGHTLKLTQLTWWSILLRQTLPLVTCQRSACKTI